MSAKITQHRILLLDPDPFLRKIRAEILVRAGYRVYPALNPEDALSRCKPGAYDLVLVNGRESENTAIEFCEKIRRNNPCQQVIVLAQPNAYICPDSSPDDVVTQGPHELMKRVEAVLSARAGS